ncbi:MAG: RagB/SusD family nutrient uptake outer membrane protein [Gemmatimonadaceae bacterium]
MRKRFTALLVGALALVGGCQDFLDVNTNPNAPQSVGANLYLSPMLHWMNMSPLWDGRFVGQYVQNWHNLATGTGFYWEQMGYQASSDNGGQQWRDVYWSIGQNLVDMMAKAQAEERWDLYGVGEVIKAWGWLSVTDLHGEMILKQAFDQTRFTFDYDTQEEAYAETQRLLNDAIKNLSRTDGAVDAAYLGRTDIIYKGDRTKWLKLANGLLAVTLNHYSNKGSYKPADVIKAVDASFTNNSDDALLAYPCASPDRADCNFFGRTRGNLVSSFTLNARQTGFILGLLDGTALGSTPDPRRTRMLSPSPDGAYRGYVAGTLGTQGLSAAQQPNNLHGYPGTAGVGLPSRYLFSDRSKIPILTYAELQFIKAEAALRSGDRNTALQAYVNGINAHFDFVNARNLDDGQSPTQITPAERAAFLADPKIVPSAANLTLTQIMTQKYIALWGWGFNETWMDMRRFNYGQPVDAGRGLVVNTGIDPATGQSVYPGFTVPTTLYTDNAGKVVWRIRPRYNSEYVWNSAALQAIGGLAADYHTKPIWIVQP